MKLYILTDENGYIISSTRERILKEQIEVELTDESETLKYKYYDGKLVELTSEEKEEFYPNESVDLEPSEQDIINATLMKEIALLKVGALNE